MISKGFCFEAVRSSNKYKQSVIPTNLPHETLKVSSLIAAASCCSAHTNSNKLVIHKIKWSVPIVKTKLKKKKVLSVTGMSVHGFVVAAMAVGLVCMAGDQCQRTKEHNFRNEE